MKKSLLIFFAVLLLFPGLSAAQEEKLYFTAPTRLPHTSRQMQTPGFWIARHPHPDQLILDPEGIETLNRRTRESGLTRDLETAVLPSGMAFAASLERDLTRFSGSSYFLPDGRSAGEEFYETVRAAMNIPAMPAELAARYGVVVHFTAQRFFPTEIPLTAEALDVHFDELQNSALDVGTPVVVLHASADGQWLYVYSSSSDGWVKAADVALADKETWKAFLLTPIPAVVTAAKADIYLNSQMTEFHDYALMGSVFPFMAAEQETYAIRIPRRRDSGELEAVTGYIKKEDAHIGYLPYTARNILEQAFRLHNAPYGWGGMYGEQDCSRFLQEVFATVGIQLPRNSSDQARIGRATSIFDSSTDSAKRQDALRQVAAGDVILPMKGHIMLYLGEVDGRFYAIHAVWAYREPSPDGDRVRVINRVVVSDLSLGEGSTRTSLMERLTAVVNVQ